MCKNHQKGLYLLSFNEFLAFLLKLQHMGGAYFQKSCLLSRVLISEDVRYSTWWNKFSCRDLNAHAMTELRARASYYSILPGTMLSLVL